MGSDFEYSDEEADYYDDDDEEMMDGTQDEDEDTMDMDEYGDDFKVSSKAKRKPYEIDYESLSQSAVEALMQDEVENIVGFLGVDESTAAILLRHHSWNSERLIEKYMDNPAAVLIAAGTALPQSQPSIPVPPSRKPTSDGSRKPTRAPSKLLSLATSTSKSSSASFTSSQKLTSSPTSAVPPTTLPSPPHLEKTCPICFDDAPDIRMLSLLCRHAACSSCWTAYLSSKINEDGEHTIRCMAEKCSIVAPDSFTHSLLVPAPGAPIGDPAEEEANLATWNRFQELLVRHFVASNPNLKYCPYPSCTNTVSCPAASSKASLTSVVPTVSCGARGIGGQMTQSQLQQQGMGLSGKEHKFCFGCNIDSDHRPVVCGVARMWLKKCRDDSETANWIKSNTKECSQCQSTIEKNGGCNHMTCKKCKYEFCWVCMGPWTEHGTAWYSCNRYDEKGGIDARDAQSKSRASLERYLHYYNRWANHEQSAKLSLDLYAKTEKKMEDMQLTSTLTWIEVQFMKKAVEEVDKCRQTLKWTYAMAYYLENGNQKFMFEDNQRDLEQAVEDLSELLESPIETENIPTLRQKVTNKTVYVQKRNEIVLEDTAQGFLDGRWKWNTTVEGFDDPENVE